MRKLASVEKIVSVRNHPNADSIELAFIKGWQVVVRKGEFKVGDKVVYISIDSWVPNTVAPFLSKGNEPREYEGVKGERLRTVKLRGELSQGLVLPITMLKAPFNMMEDGGDVSELLGVIKWEPPISTNLAGNTKGGFPHFIQKTDLERIQNVYSDMASLGKIKWVMEEKADGASCTIYTLYHRDGTYDTGVCSRNLEIKMGDDNNAFVSVAKRDGYVANLHKIGKSLAIQGELCGPGIQGNKYKLEQLTLFVFDVYLIDDCSYATRVERWEVLSQLISLGVKVSQVPHLGSTTLPTSSQECLALAEGKSKINPKQEREGIVFKSSAPINGKVVSFKSISNRFLLKEE